MFPNVKFDENHEYFGPQLISQKVFISNRGFPSKFVSNLVTLVHNRTECGQTIWDIQDPDVTFCQEGKNIGVIGDLSIVFTLLSFTKNVHNVNKKGQNRPKMEANFKDKLFDPLNIASKKRPSQYFMLNYGSIIV